MKNYNDITVMSLEYFLAEKGTLEWLLSGVTGGSVKLAAPPETAMPWEDITDTPDIRAVGEDGSVYLVQIGRCGIGDRMTELRRLAEGENAEAVHTIRFLDSEDGAGLPAYSTVHEGHCHYHTMSLSGNPAAVPLDSDVSKFLDFLAGRNEKLWQEEPFRSLLAQSGYQPCWADLLRWRRKKAFSKAYTRALAAGYTELTARSRAEEAEKRSTDTFVADVVENVNDLSRNMKGDCPIDALEVILEVPAYIISAIQLGGHSYSVDDMRSFYMGQYRGMEGRN